MKRYLHVSAALATGGLLGFLISHPDFAGFSWRYSPGLVFIGIVMFATVTAGLIRWPSRTVTGIQMMLLCMLALWLIFRVRYSFDWGSLDEVYAGISKVSGFQLPWLIPLLLPFAPLVWWSWLTPLFVGIVAAARLRGHPTVASLVTKSVLLILLLTIAYATITTYAKANALMGYPADVKINTPTLMANLALVLASAATAVHSLIACRSGKISPPADPHGDAPS